MCFMSISSIYWLSHFRFSIFTVKVYKMDFFDRFHLVHFYYCTKSEVENWNNLQKTHYESAFGQPPSTRVREFKHWHYGNVDNFQAETPCPSCDTWPSWERQVDHRRPLDLQMWKYWQEGHRGVREGVRRCEIFINMKWALSHNTTMISKMLMCSTPGSWTRWSQSSRRQSKQPPGS